MKSFLTLLLSILFLNSNSQQQGSAVGAAAAAPPPAATQPTSDYKDKTFIFDFYQTITECDEVGQNRGASVIAPKGATFTVAAVTVTDIVIEFQQWNKSTPEYDNFNYGPAIRVTQQLAPIPNDDVAVRLAAGTDGFKFFVLTKTEFAAVCSEYKYENPWSGDFGTLTTPFRFRTAPTQFTSNFSLGASFCVKRKISTNFSLGAVVGLSLTNVSLDSISTGGFVKQKTERPAVTPSINLLASWKKVDFTVGMGWDIINRNSPIETSWRYNGKPWIGVGLGITLFSVNSEKSTTTEKAAEQTSKKTTADTPAGGAGGGAGGAGARN